MPLRYYLRIALQQVIYFLFASQHLALVIGQGLLLVFASFAIFSWIIGLFALIWKAHPVESEHVINALITWVMSSRSLTELSVSYHAGNEEIFGFLSKVYFVVTIPVFIYDLIRNKPDSPRETLQRRLKWSGLVALFAATSFLLFECIWPESTWIVFVFTTSGVWLITAILSVYVFFLQQVRDGLLHLFDKEFKIG